jgi:hypothetical protein
MQIKTNDPTQRAATSTEREAVQRLMQSDDNALVFSLPEALREIRAPREQKRVMVEALMYVSGHIGGESGERAARALIQIGAM